MTYPERIFHLHGKQITIKCDHLQWELVNFCETSVNSKFLTQMIIINTSSSSSWLFAPCQGVAVQTTILPFNTHTETTEQRTIIIQQCGDWYTGRWWLDCYIWYSEKGPRRAAALPSPLLDVPNVTAHPATVSVPTSYYSMWHYNCLWTLKG